jgi:hypothetical protein
LVAYIFRTPGGEYIKKLIIKNISTSSQRIEYIPPKNPLFFLPYPAPVFLSTGMSSSIEIIYRPLEHIPQNETITFKCTLGTFQIPLIATVPTLSIAVPTRIDFSLCPVNETTAISFEVMNTGDLEAPFEFKIPEDCALLILEPISGVIPSKHSALINAYYTPREASIMTCDIGCVSSNSEHFITFTATGKYPHIQSSMTEIAFGDVCLFAVFYLLHMCACLGTS